jgi:hypothetical protein
VTALRSDLKVLVVAVEPILAALIGSLAENSGLQAAFVQPGESVTAAFERVRPIVALLLESSAAAESDVLLVRARKRGIAVFLFGPRKDIQQRSPWASGHQLPLFVIPDDVERLHEALERLPGARESTGAQRRASVERRGDGVLVFADANGRRWTVYDRRGRDARGHFVDRRFVGDDGKVRHCHLSLTEAERMEPEQLESQFARAEPDPF